MRHNPSRGHARCDGHGAHAGPDWFAGLWYGKNLAFTIAVLTVVAALVYRFFATPLPPPEELDEIDGPRPGPRRL